MKKTFTIDESECKEMQEWLEEHNKTCRFADPNVYTGAIGGRLSYHFFPSSIGMIITVECGCGEKRCISDN